MWNLFGNHFKLTFYIGTTLLLLLAAHHLVGYLEVTSVRHWQMHSFSLILLGGSFAIFTTFVTIQHRSFLNLLICGHIMHCF